MHQHSKQLPTTTFFFTLHLSTVEPNSDSTVGLYHRPHDFNGQIFQIIHISDNLNHQNHVVGGMYTLKRQYTE